MTTEEDTATEDNVIESTQDTDATDATSDDEYSNEISVQKRSSKLPFLSLFFSLVALGLSAYSFYFYHWNNTQNNNPQNTNQLPTEISRQIQQLNQDLEDKQLALVKLEAEFNTYSNATNRQLDALNNPSEGQSNDQAVTNQISQLSEQIEDLRNKSMNTLTDPIVLNTDQLVSKNELNELIQQIDTLDSQLKNSLQESSGVTEEIEDNQVLINQYNIRRQLNMAEVYLQLDSPNDAEQSLSAALDGINQQSMPYLTEQINQARQAIAQQKGTDDQQIKQQLKQAREHIQQLEYELLTTPVSEGRWYDKFVSVRKIDEQSSVQSSYEFNVLKSELQHQLMLAELALQTNNQTQWDMQFNATLAILQEHFSSDKDLLKKLTQLKETVVKPDYPAISAIIEHYNQTVANGREL